MIPGKKSLSWIDAMRNEIPELDAAGLRKFAITTGALVALIFGLFLPWAFNFNHPLWPWVFLCVSVLWGVIAPSSLRPVYLLWMRFGLLLNKVTSPVIMGLVFFLVLLPTALVMRYILSRDPLRLAIRKDVESYRVISKAQDSEHLSRPF